jgi:adenylylsulfate kinase-like enzyme
MIYLITGQPGTGKTTAATKLYEKLCGLGEVSYRLDGDNMRKVWPFIGYDDDSREISMGYILTLSITLNMVCEPANIIISFVGPIAEAREKFHKTFKDNIKEIRFTEILKERPPEHYSTFYEGNIKPDIVGWDEFNKYLEEL